MYTSMSLNSNNNNNNNNINNMTKPEPAPSSNGQQNAATTNGNNQQLSELQNVLRGNFQQNLNVPSPKLRQIRIFLCSTQSDFFEERDVFWFEILPELQQHCLQYGADVLLFDPYQGTENDPVYQPHVAQQLLRQIQECRLQSEGVFFVGLLGDKYGPCPLPTSLRGEEFQNIISTAFEAGKDVKVFQEWYKLDQNANPPNYDLMQTFQNKNFDSKIFDQLQETLQYGAHLAHQDGLINQVNPKLQERFFTSFVEQAVQLAVEGWKQYQSNCLFILRKLDGAQNNANNSAYFDEIKDAKVWNPQESVSRLKNSLSDTMDKNNVELFKITCQPGDTTAWRRTQNWEKYIKKFVKSVTAKLKSLVDATYASGSRWNKCQPSTDKFIRANPFVKSSYEDSWNSYQEILLRKPAKFIGHVDTLKKLRDLCREGQKKSSSPIVIQGDEGTGKSALLCEVASVIRTWIGADVTVVVRFVGVVGGPNIVHELLRSLCLQICVAHSLDSLLTTYKDVYSADRLAEWLEQCCTEAAKKSGQPVVVLIDDLHLLKYGHSLGCRRNQSHNFQWIPSSLPPNVIVVVTASGQSSIESLPVKKVDAKYVLRLPNSLNDKDLLEINKCVLTKYQKPLTADQQGAIKQALKSCPSPLYAVTLGHEARLWSTYQAFNGKGLPTTLSIYLDQKFARLEKLWGAEFCANICTYLECANNGLTETEIFDLMSNNRETMQALSLDDDSIRICRLPCAMWLSFKNELGFLLYQRILDGKIVYSWSHSLISAVVRNRYFNSTQQLKKCNSDLVALFSDLWSMAADNDCHEDSTNGKLNYKFVMPQPLYRCHATTNEVYYNYRRVNSLWYHLLHSGSIDEFEEQSLCNFEYLYTLLNAIGLTRLLSVMEDTSLQILNHNLHMLQGIVLKPCLLALSNTASLLAAEIIGRLRYTRILGKNTTALNNLVDQAMTWVDNNSKSPLLVPLTCWIKPPMCPLVVTFQLQEWTAGSTTIIRPTKNYQHLLAAGAGNGTIWMYHNPSNTLVKTFTGHTNKILCLEVSHNGHFFVTSSADQSVRSWDIIQGVGLKTMKPHTGLVTCLLLTDDDQYLVTGSADATAKLTDLETGNVIRTFNGRAGAVRAMSLSSHSEYLVTGHSDFFVIIWIMDSGEMASQLGGLMAPVSHIALTSNDTFLLVASDDETVKVFSLCRGTELHELRGHEGKVLCLAVADDDCQIFCGNSDGNIYCYDLHSGQLISVQNCHNAPITSLKVTEGGHFLFSGCAEHVHVWNIERASDHRRQEDGKNLAHVAMTRDFKYVATSNFAGLVYLWDLEMCNCLWITQDEPPTRVTHLQFDNDGTLLFSGALDGSVNVWSMANGSLLRKYKGHSVTIRTIQIFSDRSRILSHDISGAVKIWRLLHNEDEDEDDTEVQLKGTGDLLRLVSDGEILAKVADLDKELRVWSFAHEDGIVTRAKMTHNDAITCLSMSRDSKYVVTGSKDQSLKIWEASTGYLTQILVGHNEGIVCCVLNDTFQVVVSAASDNSIYAWDVDTGTIMSAFTEPVKGLVTTVAVTADGSLALTGYKDGWLYAWATETGAKVASFQAHMPIGEVLATPEAHRIVLRLEQCPHLSVICLHNCPVLGETLAAKKRKQSRTLSAASSSGGTRSSHNSGENVMSPSTKDGAALQRQSSAKGKSKGTEKRLERKASKVFAPIERSRSRATLYDSPTTTTKFVEQSSSDKFGKSQLPANQNSSSKVCTIL